MTEQIEQTKKDLFVCADAEGNCPYCSHAVQGHIDHEGQCVKQLAWKALQAIEFLQKRLSESVPMVHAEWILKESPYAEHEEAVDGESHPRWVCSHCGNEAGFECDPDGFAGWQERTTWCGHCGRLMNAKEGYANEKAGR